jgi:hypothetical protein
VGWILMYYWEKKKMQTKFVDLKKLKIINMKKKNHTLLLKEEEIYGL